MAAPSLVSTIVIAIPSTIGIELLLLKIPVARKFNIKFLPVMMPPAIHFLNVLHFGTEAQCSKGFDTKHAHNDPTVCFFLFRKTAMRF
jgi:hypothetical protein